MHHYAATIIRVIDGDTVVADVDLGFRTFTRQTLRLYGINAPEIRGFEKQAGIAATEYLKNQLSHEPITVRTIRDRQGKFGRYLAVLFNSRGTNINREMISDGHAVPYE